MKKKIISLILAFLMLVTTLPVLALAQEGGAASEELEKTDYEFERIDGQDYIKISLPANSVEITEDPYVIRPMSITDNVPDKSGAGHLINWGTGVVWYDYKNVFPPKDGKYIVELRKLDKGKSVVIGEVEITKAATSLNDMKPEKDTTFQFKTNENYVKGDENLNLEIRFPVRLRQNILYEVDTQGVSGTFNGGNKYNLVFLKVSRLVSPIYTAEWDTTNGALKPTLKGRLYTSLNEEDRFKIFSDNDRYGSILNEPPVGYIEEKNRKGALIERVAYEANGKLTSDDVRWSKGSNIVMNGEFSSYVVSVNGQPQEKPLNNKKGTIPSYTEMQADFTTGTFKQVKYPAYFYNLVGDNDHMWRFQMKEGLELKFNTGVGSATQGGQTGQDIGNTQTVAYGEKFDSALKGSFSENTLTLPETTNLVAPTLNKNNLKMKFIGWKLVQGFEVPVNPQKVETDGEGKQTLTAVTPDYADKAALETALKAADFKGFTEKNPVFYAIYGQTQGKANIKYVDDEGTELAEGLKIQGQDYKTEKVGELNEAVTANINEAPQFKGYAITKVEIEPTTDAKYVDPATATIKFIYKAKATTDDKSSDQDYIKVTFNANEGHFGTETEKTKNVWVLKDKATFADAKGKVSNPTKDNAFFNEWQTAVTGGTKVADEKTLSTADETFYANYTTKAQGKASVEYLDVKTGQAIEDKYRSEDAAKYPAEKEGNQGTKIPTEIFTKDTAPKFVGYEFNRVEVSPKDGTYALPATSTIKVYYDKLPDVVPGTDPGTNKPNPKPDGYVTVTFQPGTNGTLTGETIFHVNPKADPVKTMAEITEPTITANTGFKVADPKWKDAKNVALNKATQITTDLTYTAQYTKVDDVVPVPDPTNPPKKPDGYVTVKFDLDGKGTTTNTVEFYVNPGKEVTINPPTVKGIKGYTIKKGDDAWNPKFVSKATYAKDTIFVAQYTFSSISDTEVEGFNKVTFKPGDHGTLTEKSVWVQPNTLVDISDKAPIVTANTGYSHIGWKPGLIGKFDNNSQVVAQYSSSISNEPIPGWSEILFNSGEHGRFDNGTRNVVWVDPDKEVKLDFMTARIIPYINYSFDKWTDANGDVDLSVAKKYTDNAEFTGNYKPDVSYTNGDIEITFKPGDHGKFADGAKTKIYVTKDKLVDLTEFAPTVIPNQGYGHSGWEPALKGTFKQATDIIAQYKPGTFNKDKVKEVIVLGPNKMGYGVGENIDLTGLKVIAIDDAGLQETYDGVDAIKTAGFNIEPADKTVLNMDDNGKHIVVTKGVDPNKVTGQSQTTLTIHENKSAKAENVKALNQNIEENGKVTDKPKTTTTVTGKAKAGSTVIIKNEAGEEIGKVEKVPANGEFTAEVTKQDEGKKVQVIVTEEGKQPSDPEDAIVARDADNNKISDKNEQTERPAAVASNKGKDPKFTTIVGKTEPGAVITVTLKDGTKVKVDEFKIGTDGNYTLQATEGGKPLDNGTEILVYAENKPKKISNPQNTTVFNDFNEDGKPDGGKVDLDKIQDIQVIDPNKMTYVEKTDGSLDLTGLKVVVRDTLDGIQIFEYDTTDNKFKDGNKALDGFTVKIDTTPVAQKTTLTSKDHNNKKITVAYGNKSGETIQALKVTKTLPAPEVDDVKKSDTTVKIKVPTNGETKITVKVGDKEVVAKRDSQDGQWKVGTTPVNTVDGKLQIPVEELKQGDVVKVTTEDPAGNQGQAEKQVPVDEYSKKPTELKAKNEPATPEKTTVTGKATPGATITIKDKNGKELTTEPTPIKVGQKGTFKATIDKKEPNTLLLVSAKEENKLPSADVPAQVEGSKDIVPVDPNKGGTDKPEGFVTVTFAIQKADKSKGTLEGGTAYYVNPKVDVQLNPPTFKAKTGYKLIGWDQAGKLTLDAKKYNGDTTIYAVIGEVPDVVPGKDPNTGEDNKKPEGYVEITFAVDTKKGNFGDKAETKFFVNPEKDVKLTAPEVTVTDLAYTMEGWDNPNWNGTDFNIAKYANDTLITATFVGSYVAPPVVDDVVTGDTTVKVNPGNADKVTVEVEGQGTVIVKKDPNDGNKWKTPDGTVIIPDDGKSKPENKGKLSIPVKALTEKALVEVTVEKDGVASEKVAKTAKKQVSATVASLGAESSIITVRTYPAGAKVTLFQGEKEIDSVVSNILGVANIQLKEKTKLGQYYTIKVTMDGYEPYTQTFKVE